MRALIEPFTGHGGRIDRARAAFPEWEDWLDLSTGIAPWSYPVALDPEDARRLPDPAELARLEVLAAGSFGVAAERVVAVPGSDLALRLLGRMLPGPRRWIEPGYAGHRAMWGGQGHGVDRAAWTEEGLAGAQLVLARPNNPDGWMADADEMETAARMLAERGGHLIVDEAFVDAVPEQSLAGRDWPGLILLRSFGKFFGLAGLRLGFVIAPEGLAGELRGMIGDWPLSGPALAAGLAAYADRDWQAAQRARLLAGSQRMTALIADHGLTVRGATAFFTLIESPARDALFLHLARAGILTRPFADRPDWLRLGLPGDEAGWEKLAIILTRWSKA